MAADSFETTALPGKPHLLTTSLKVLNLYIYHTSKKNILHSGVPVLIFTWEYPSK